MLVSQFLNLIFQRRDVLFQRLRGAAVIRHCAHDPGSLDGFPDCDLVAVTEEVFESALDVSIDRNELP